METLAPVRLARRALLLVALAATVVDGRPAAAQQPAGADLMALGRQEFDKGQADFNLGHYDEALAHFEASYRLTAKPTILFNLGVVQKQIFERTRRLENLRLAADRFRSYLEATRLDTDEKAVKQRTRAEEQLKECDDKLAAEQAARAKGEEALQVGEDLLVRGKADDAAAQLDRYEKSTGNERPGVARALMLRGGIAAARNDEPAATEAFQRALTLDRAAALPPTASVLARKAFAAASDQLKDVPPLAIGHAPPASIRLNTPIDLVFTITGDPRSVVSGVQVYYRTGAGAFSSTPTQAAAPSTRVSLPRPFVAGLLPGARIEYYANAVDRNGAVIEHLGSSSLPFSAQVEQPSKGIGWKVGAGVGAAAVAGGLAGTLGWYFTQPPPPIEIPIDNALRGL